MAGESFWDRGADIDGTPGKVGDLVFWATEKRPWWIVEWQPQNGNVFVIVNCEGDIATAAPGELTRDFRKREA